MSPRASQLHKDELDERSKPKIHSRLFNSMERQTLIFSIIEEDFANGGAGVDISGLENGSVAWMSATTEKCFEAQKQVICSADLIVGSLSRMVAGKGGE